MCGIAGVLDWNGVSESLLTPMLENIIHRGPDDEGRFAEGPVAMGMRRLSIIDISGGHQPISNEDDSVVAVFNGEIYNYVELREDLIRKGHTFKTHSDTEVLVHLYEEEQMSFLPKLNGMFGFSIWDKKRKRLFVARDRLGVKPMYYARHSQGVMYGSELKSILSTGKVEKQLRPEALLDYLTYYYIPGEQTPFNGIEKLLPGHYFTMDSEGFNVRQWWDLADYVPTTKLSYDDAKDRVRELFLDSIRLRMRSDVPVGAYLSGGLDSSLATCAAASQTDIPISTFSVGFTQTAFDELPFARAVSSHAGTNHHEISVSPDDALAKLPNLVWHMDEPNGDSAMLPSFLVSQLAAEHVKVVLSGIGADELFGGYHRYHEVLGKFERLQKLPVWMLKLMRPVLASAKHDWGRKLDRMISPMPQWREFMDKTHQYDDATVATLLGNVSSEKHGFRMQQAFANYPGNDYVNQRMFADAHTYLPDQILALTDRMSMAASLEARTPFLDYRLVEFATSLPGEWKVRGADWKRILKDALGDLVPQQIITRPKWGFSAPVQSWMSSRHLDALIHLVRDSHLVSSGYLDSKTMDSILSVPENLSNRSDWLWTLGILEIWYRVYFEGDINSAPTVNLVDFAGI